MRTPHAILVLAFICLSSVAFARELTLPEGLKLDPPDRLDVTYQIIPSYDEQEKVIAGWAGDRLQYFVVVSRLPPDYTDAQAYQAGMARDLRTDWGDLKTGRRDRYRTVGGLNGDVVEYIKPSTDPDRPPVSLFVHFLSDGKVSYVATATPVPPATLGRVFEDTLSLLRTAALTDRVAPRLRSEDAFVGAWTIEERLPNGKTMTARVDLKGDLTFATRVRVGEQVILEATGVWWRSANRLHWTYLYSNPALPADRRDDTDTVVASDRNIIIVRSSTTNKERTMRRVR